MNQLGHYRVPKKLQDEDHYFKFFTKIELFFMILVIAPTIVILKFTISSGSSFMAFLGFFMAFFLVGGMLVLLKLKLPDRFYLIGTNMPLYIIVIRVIRKKLIRKTLYINHYEERRLL